MFVIKLTLKIGKEKKSAPYLERDDFPHGLTEEATCPAEPIRTLGFEGRRK